jgi:DnaK suppressor protein
MAAKKKVNKKSVAKKKPVARVVKKPVAKKKTAKKKIAVKKPVVKKKTIKKKKTVAKKAAAKKPAAKKPVAKKKTAKKKIASKKSVVRKKTINKKTAAKKPAAKKPVAKKKTAAKVAKKKVIASKPAKKAVVAKPVPAPKKISAKKIVPESSGKAKIFELKNKVFRRSPTDVQTFKPYSAARGEEYMNAAQSAHFRNILLDWKKVLMEEVDRTVHHMQDEAANFPDPNDRATQEEEFALELRTRDRERKLIRKIDEAILSLETGDYGYCEVCGVEIGVKRLEARPTATLCIDCKTLDEIKEKQLG